MSAMKISMKSLNTSSAEFDQELDKLLAWDSVSDHQVVSAVKDILAAVKQRGDQALVDYTNQFDQLNVSEIGQLIVPADALHGALHRISPEQRLALENAAQRIRRYHEHQRQDSWQFRESDGTVLGQKVTPLAKVGLYVPGGKASYPSSVLMNAVPAKVAGVKQLVMTVPTPGGDVNDMVMAAAAIAEVDQVFTIGGAQAIAALAFGTQGVPKVDKIVGPGNIYVATAKRLVFGEVGLDMIAGPSEIVVLCDGHTDPDWIAMDLFSQAEHDEAAQAILISPDGDFLDSVKSSIETLLPSLERSDIIRASLQRRGALVKVRDLAEAIALCNRIAPEHLELSVEKPEAILNDIEHAGAVFMGRYTAEALGDYCAGPNHVLPTSGTARFSSPLGVYDFQKRTSIIHCSPQGASELGKIASVLAEGESLTAHARSARYRIIPSS